MAASGVPPLAVWSDGAGCDRAKACASTRRPGRDCSFVGVAAAVALWCSNPSPGICTSICSTSKGQGAGFEYVYPSSWVLERVRGIEVIAHDPNIEEFNMTITTGPAQRAKLGSPAEVGKALISRYRTVPDVKEAVLLSTESSSDEPSGSRKYTLELRVVAGEDPRRFLFRILKTEKKVYTLVIQVPEGYWQNNAECARSLLDGLKT